MSKYLLLVLVAVILPLCIVGCSPDREEGLTEEVIPTESTEPEPQIDWVNSTIRIKTGIRKSGKEMLDALIDLRCVMTRTLANILASEDEDIQIPIAPEEKEVIISIVSMAEVGMKRSATMPEIVEWFRAAGYRPVTLQEIIELRIQFLSQLPIAREKTSAFFALLSEEEKTLFTTAWEKRVGWKLFQTVCIYRYQHGQSGKDNLGITLTEEEKFHPGSSPDMMGGSGRSYNVPGGTRFACVKMLPEAPKLE